MKLKSEVYDTLKWVDVIFLPAFGAFYLSLGNLWNFPQTTEVGATAAIIATFLGALLQISNSNFKNDPDAYLTHVGTNEDTGHPDMKLTIVKPPAELLSKKSINLKVGPPPPPPTVV